MSRPSIDLVNGPTCCATAFLEGRMWGRAEGLSEGYRRGYDACDQEISTLQREAARIVHALSEAPERDHAADAQRAEVRRRWWARRRGEEVTS